MRQLDRVRLAVFLGVAPLSCAAACGACGESGAAAPAHPVIDSGAESAVDARVEASAHDGDATADVQGDGCVPRRPASVPPGWEAWTGWSCDCPLYYPGENGEMPKPIEWEPCDEPLPAGVVCQRMNHFWNETGIAIALFPKMSIDPSSGKPLIAFARIGTPEDPNVDYRIVAEADGAVRTAYMKANPLNKGCATGEESLNEGRYLFKIDGDTWDEPLSGPNVTAAEGMMAGRVGEFPPPVLKRLSKSGTLLSNWSVSAAWIVQWHTVQTAWSWDLADAQIVYGPGEDPDHLPPGRPILLGDEALIPVGDGLPAGVMTWNVKEGIRPLIRWYGDSTQGAGNFGTDGTDMVWTYVAGDYLGSAKFETMSVMTAPFTTSQATVTATARRVRADLKGFEGDGWTVGCGYAARAPGLGSPLNNAMYIVRLSDGVSWTLPGKLDLPRIDWDFPLAMTCDEMFAMIEEVNSTTNTARIVRVRLDSLGPGTPPD